MGYIGVITYNPLTNHLPTSGNIQVGNTRNYIDGQLKLNLHGHKCHKLVIFHEAIDCAVQSTKPIKDAKRNAGDLFEIFAPGLIRATVSV